VEGRKERMGMGMGMEEREREMELYSFIHSFTFFTVDDLVRYSLKNGFPKKCYDND